MVILQLFPRGFQLYFSRLQSQPITTEVAPHGPKFIFFLPQIRAPYEHCFKSQTLTYDLIRKKSMPKIRRINASLKRV